MKIPKNTKQIPKKIQKFFEKQNCSVSSAENVVHLGIFGISGIPKISVIPFNTIEYWKCSIPKFQYYWILKMFNSEISILLNIENFQYQNFNTIEYRKNFNTEIQYYQNFGY